MTASQLYEWDGVTVSTSEISAVTGNAYNAANNSSQAGGVQFFLDTTNMAKGDEFEIKVYEKVEATGGTARLLDSWRLLGVQPTNFVTPVYIMLFAWDFTVKRIAGADRTFDASVRTAG